MYLWLFLYCQSFKRIQFVDVQYGSAVIVTSTKHRVELRTKNHFVKNIGSPAHHRCTVHIVKSLHKYDNFTQIILVILFSKTV